MTPIDTKALGRRAGYILFTDGPEQPAATAREAVLLLDALAQAEARIQAVRDVLDEVDRYGTPIFMFGHRQLIRRALDTEETP